MRIRFKLESLVESFENQLRTFRFVSWQIIEAISLILGIIPSNNSIEYLRDKNIRYLSYLNNEKSPRLDYS